MSIDFLTSHNKKETRKLYLIILEIHHIQQLSLTNLLVKLRVNAFILEEQAPHRTKVRLNDNGKYNKGRQVLRQQRKKKKNDISYIPGAFSTKITPDIDCTSNGQIPTIQKQVNIVFIDDNNVVDFIKDYYFQ